MEQLNSTHLSQSQSIPFSVLTGDGVELKGFIHPLKSPKAICYIVHGFSEHQGRYAYLVQKLLAANFQPITYDHRGHGLSGGQPGYVPKFKCLMQDLILVLDKTLAHRKNLPVFLYAHSMGGGIALNTLLTQELPCTVTGMIASSPWLQVKRPPTLLQRIGGQISRRLFPRLTLHSGITPGSLTHNQEREAEYFADPLVHQRVGGELFYGTQEAGELTLKLADQWKIPLLLMHGDSDPVTAFQASVQFYQQAPKQLVEFKAWPGLLHETHQENNRDEVIGWVLGWLNKRLN